MTISIGSVNPAPISGRTRQEAREARRRQHIVTFVMLAAAARMAVDRRTLAGIITIAIGLVGVKGLGSERGTPVLDWYPDTRTRRDPPPGIAARRRSSLTEGEGLALIVTTVRVPRA